MNNNRFIKFLFCILFTGFLFSCENKTVDYGLDTYYVEIVTAQNNNQFLTDKGNLLVATSEENQKTYVSGDRVLLNYTLLDTTASGSNYSVRINASAKIPLGKITYVNASVIQSAVKEPIQLESIWIGSHYLNMQFYLNYMSTTHSIGLLVDSTRLQSDTLRMYFIHNSNNDPPGYPVHTYLSFDLKDTLGDPGETRPATVQINTSDYGNKTYEFEY